MSREILFRAKSIYQNVWIEGDLFRQSHKTNILNNKGRYQVDPSTVCQYTGLCAEDGTLIFEGDILEARFDDEHPEDVTRVVVKWILFGWYLCQTDKSLPDEMGESDIDLWTVAGNIWDNPELLEGGAGKDDWKEERAKMTNQEAIEMLKNEIRYDYDFRHLVNAVSAIDMAVAALEEKAEREESQNRDDELFRALYKRGVDNE